MPLTKVDPQVEENRRLLAVAEAHRVKVRHVCPLYVTARNEVVNPAQQGGIGCPICYPPDGRVR